MNENLVLINEKIYKKGGLALSEFIVEKESHDYASCRFRLEELAIVCRNAKVTPKK